MRAAPGTIVLRIQSRAGAALAGARVTVDGTPHAALTAADGTAALTGLAPGAYTLMIEPGDSLRYTHAVTLGADGVALRLALGGGAAVPLETIVPAAPSSPGAAGQTREARAGTMLDMVEARFPVARDTAAVRRGGHPVLCGGSRGPRTGCAPVSVIVNGMRLYGTDAAAMLDSLSPDEIEDVEYLDPVQTTLRYSGSQRGTGRHHHRELASWRPGTPVALSHRPNSSILLDGRPPSHHP